MSSENESSEDYLTKSALSVPTCERPKARTLSRRVVKFGLLAALATALPLQLFGATGGVSAELPHEDLQTMPTALASLDLSRRAERIVTATPSLLSVSTTGEQSEVLSALTGDIERLGASLKDLRAHGIESQQAALMERLVGQLGETLEVLDRTVSARLAIHHLMGEQREAASRARWKIVAELKPWSENAAAAIAEARADLATPGLSPDRQLTLSQGLLDALLLQRQIDRAIESANRAELALMVAASCEPDDDVTAVKQQFKMAFSELTELAPVLEEVGLPSIAEPIAVLRRVSYGPQSIGNLRRVELKMLTAAETALARNADLARQFSGTVDQLVSLAQEATSPTN